MQVNVVDLRIVEERPDDTFQLAAFNDFRVDHLVGPVEGSCRQQALCHDFRDRVRVGWLSFAPSATKSHAGER